MNTTSLQGLVTFLDAMSEKIGHTIAWLALFMVITQFGVVVLRYLFNIGWIAMQESILYMHAILFMLGAAYTLKHDAHVRVDVFYHKLGQRGKAWINIAGSLFLLLPVCLFIFTYSYEYVATSWALYEGSREAGGLPGLFILKTSILLLPTLLSLQGISLILKSILVILDPNTAEIDEDE